MVNGKPYRIPVFITGMNLVDCDVALIQGFTPSNGKDLPI